MSFGGCDVRVENGEIAANRRLAHERDQGEVASVAEGRGILVL